MRVIAESDLGTILNDSVTGFAWDISVANPAQFAVMMKGFANDIGIKIDPETGGAVSGRTVTVALRIKDLIDVGLGIPVAIADTTLKPWLIQFDNINGVNGVYKVMSVEPDHALGVVVCFLESYTL